MDRLLSVKDVAELLNMSSRTVYDHMRELGGFYPAGIRLLRFHPEVIYGVMEGQDKERRTANEKERMRTILYQPDGPYKGIGGQRP